MDLLRPLRAIRGWWRGSLLVRVTATTLVEKQSRPESMEA